MKQIKEIAFWIAVIFSFAASVNSVVVTNKINLSGESVNEIVDDLTASGITDSQLVTALAVKNFLQNASSSPDFQLTDVTSTTNSVSVKNDIPLIENEFIVFRDGVFMTPNEDFLVDGQDLNFTLTLTPDTRITIYKPF